MKTTIIIDSKTTQTELKALSAMIQALIEPTNDPKPIECPEGLDIAPSHEPINLDPSNVTVYTSTDGGDLVGEFLNTNDMVDRVITKTVEKDVDGQPAEVTRTTDSQADLKAVKKKLAEIKKDQEARQAKEDNPPSDAESYAERKEDKAPSDADHPKAAKPNPDAKAIVEAVVGVKTETKEAEGTIDKVVEDLEKPVLLTTQFQKEIRALTLKASKYGYAEEAKKAVRDIVGGSMKLSEIPMKFGKEIADTLAEIVAGAEADG